MITVIGVDPGGRKTGIVRRRGTELLTARVLVREGDEKLPDGLYLTRVVDAIDDELEACDDAAVVAVEGLHHPSPHERVVNVLGLIGTGMTLGAVLAAHPDAVVVPPGGNGSLPPSAYPAAIRPHARLKGGGQTKDARSAWDVAGAAPFLARVRQARTPTRRTR